MHNEFTAIVERDGEWYIAYCPEVPGANGQGFTREESLESLGEAIALILEQRAQRADKDKFNSILDRVPDVEPDQADQL